MPFPSVLGASVLRALVILTVLATGAGASAQGLPGTWSPEQTARLVAPDMLADRIAAEDRVRVIVEFDEPAPPAGRSFDLDTQAGVAVLNAAVAGAQDRILTRSLGAEGMRAAETAGNPVGLVRFQSVPMFALNVDAELLRALASDPDVRHIHIDEISQDDLSETVPLIGMPASFIAGATGNNQTVVVLDSGTRGNHSFYANRVVGEACFNANALAAGRQSFCPGGAATSTASGSACTFRAGQICNHGTHIAGIAAGFSAAPTAGNPGSGVARAANVFAVNISSCSAGTATTCTGSIGSFTSDAIAAMDHVFNVVRFQRNIAAVNISQGQRNSAVNSPCLTSAPRGSISNLRNVGIATTVSAGNSANDNAVGLPYACIPEAITVANTTKADARSGSSDWGALVNLAAPGNSIRSSFATSTTAYGWMSGTSMAAPHVAGAIAAIRSRRPGDTVATIQNALFNTGVPVTAVGRTHRRIDVAAALRTLGINTRPPNNLFANRFSILTQGIRFGRNLEATAETGQPNIAITGSRNAVWWRYTAPQNGTISIDTCDSYTDFNTTLAVFTGTRVDALSPVASNVNACGTGSRVTFAATAGTEYQIAVAGVNNASGMIGLRVSFATPAATTTQLSGPATVSFGQIASFAATVTSATGTPTGVVEFRRNGVQVGTRLLNASGQAVYSTSANPVGSYQMTAHFRGSASFAASTSAPRALTVTRAPSNTSLNAPTTGLVGESLTFQATVSGSTGIPQGTVSFRRNGVEFGQAATTAAGFATLSAPLPLGTHQITARFLGSATYLESLSPARTLVIEGPPPAETTALLTGPTSGEPGEALTFEVAVTSEDGTPDGTVSFLRDGNSFAQRTLGAAGLARVTTSDLPEGTHRIAVRYAGNDDFAESLSNVLTVTITAPVPPLQVAAGMFHSCALHADQTVSCWGRNASGQLGDGTTTNSDIPVPVAGLNRVTRIDVGYRHSCALRTTGRAFCWGANEAGQLGDGTTIDRTRPVRVRRLDRITQIAAGDRHSCALRDTGIAFCWGGNDFGQLGNNTTDDQSDPVRVQRLNNVVELAAGWRHTCALRTTGRAFCWGRNFNGQLGDGTTTDRLRPNRVRQLTNVVEISAGGGHSCAVRDTGRVFCWGRNQGGQLGDNSTTDRSTPVRVVAATQATRVSAGDRHSCALRETGVPFCWGVNGVGQVGDGSNVNRSVAVAVSGLNRVVWIAAGGRHGCAARDTGRFFCWGNNGSGQLGDGSNDGSNVPVRVR